MLVWPVPLLCNVLKRFADAKLSLLSGLGPGVGPKDLARGGIKWANGTAVSDIAVDVVGMLFLLVAGPPDIAGITRLVRIE